MCRRRRRRANAALPGQHLVQHAAERPDVGALVDRLPARLLRAHVRGGAENDALARPADASSSATASDRRRRVARHRFRQAEVEDLHDALGRDLDVGRLQIAVDDPFLVRRVERVRDLRRDRQRLVERNGTLRDAIRQRRSLPPIPGLMPARHRILRDRRWPQCLDG